ncbi:hypothetical protein, partial [Klebsiella pneumoniae]|uniref:hypothetical protein n=1 Tax=Klebsiella pneumoniae TaxID=573 RepID=UPI000A64881C
VKTAPKTSKKTLKSAEAEALKVALDAAQVEYVPVTALVKSPLNVRTIPYPAEKRSKAIRNARWKCWNPPANGPGIMK